MFLVCPAVTVIGNWGVCMRRGGGSGIRTFQAQALLVLVAAVLEDVAVVVVVGVVLVLMVVVMAARVVLAVVGVAMEVLALSLWQYL